MNLIDYSSKHPIFIDANIFLYHALPNSKYGAMVSDFLERIERQEISAIATPSVLSEVSYVLLVQKGMALLKNTSGSVVRDKIKTDSHFASLCYDSVDMFNEFISNLDGLKVIPVQPEDYLIASDLGRIHRLLPIDALHLSAMRRSHIRNIASRDRDFERVDGISVWSP